MKLTSELTKQIANKMASDLGVKIHYKPDSKFMWVLGWGVSATTEISHKQFMRDFSTAFRKGVYLKFHMGNLDYPFISQLSHLGHEFEHTQQSIRRWDYEIEYLAKPSITALYEAAALCVNLECTYLYVDRKFDWEAKVHEYGDRLSRYRCSDKDIAAAKEYMISFMATLLSVQEPITDIGITMRKAFIHFGVIENA